MGVRGRQKERFPWGLWILALLTLGLAFVFFVLPRYLQPQKMQIEIVRQDVDK